MKRFELSLLSLLVICGAAHAAPPSTPAMGFEIEGVWLSAARVRVPVYTVTINDGTIICSASSMTNCRRTTLLDNLPKSFGNLTTK